MVIDTVSDFTYFVGRCCSGPCSSPLALDSLGKSVYATQVGSVDGMRTSCLVAHLLAVVALEVGRVGWLGALLCSVARLLTAKLIVST